MLTTAKFLDGIAAGMVFKNLELLHDVYIPYIPDSELKLPYCYEEIQTEKYILVERIGFEGRYKKVEKEKWNK